MSNKIRKSIKSPTNRSVGLSVYNNRPQAALGAILAPIISSIGSLGGTLISTGMSNNANKKIAERNNRLEQYNQTLQEATNMSNQYEGSLTTNQDYNNQYNTQYNFGGKRSLKNNGNRDKAFIGTAIATAVGLGSTILGGILSNKARKREAEKQRRLQEYNNTLQEATQLTDALTGTNEVNTDYQQQFNTKAKLGLHSRRSIKPIITDGGDAIKISNNTFLLRGGSHEDINESGQTGIGINIGGKQIEAEGGEIAQIKNKQFRIFSDEPILGNGISPAKAVIAGANKDKIFNAQERFKRIVGLNDDGTARYSSPVKGYSNKHTLRLGGTQYDNNYYNELPLWDNPITGGTYGFGSGKTPIALQEVSITPTTPIQSKSQSTINTAEINNKNVDVNFKTNKSGMAIRTGDWIGLGTDIVGSIVGGILANKGVDDISLPERPGFMQAAKLKTTYNVNPQEEELNHSRRRIAEDINSGTSSSVAALNRRNLVNTKTTDEINKLYAQKENIETELLNKDALNQQEVAGKNLAIQTDWTNKVADIKNAKTNAKLQGRSMSLQGIAGAGRNFLGQTMQRYEDIQGMRYALAASDNGTAYRMLNSGIDLDKDTVGSIFINELNANRKDPGEFKFIDGEKPEITAQRRKIYDRDLLNYKHSADVLNSAYSRLSNKQRKSLKRQGILTTSW